MHKRKIVFKVPEFPHLTETFIVAQIVTAIKLGYEIEILVRKRIEESTNLRSNLIEEYGLLKKVIIEDYKIPKNRILRYIKWILLLVINVAHFNNILSYHKEQSKFSLTCLFQWVFYNRFIEADLFHVQYGTNSNPLATLKKTGFKPALIVTFHGHDAFFPISGYIHNNGYYDNLFKYGNLITANTPYLADKIIELGCPKELLSIVPVGVDTEFFYPIKKAVGKYEKSKLITVGRLSVVKGHIYAFVVVKKLKEAGYNVVLTVVGEGSERLNLENYIKDNKLNDSIVLVGAKSQEEIRELLRDNDIFLFPSVPLHYGKSTETQGLANNEAMACGLPVVVFDSGGVKYTLEDGISGFVCDEYDIDCMISKVKILIEDTEMAKKMSDKAVTFVNKIYSQKVIDSKWKTIYNNLSNER
jgi:colanic acid/amylovoran biosynthesis glycosyltransferase